MVPSVGDLVHYSWTPDDLGLVLESVQTGEESRVLVLWFSTPMRNTVDPPDATMVDGRRWWVPCDRWLEIRSYR